MKKILIIEDERTFANIVGELIQGVGFECVIVYSAEEAEAYFSKLGTEIHVVILDLMMTRTGSFAKLPPHPGETGDEIYEKIRTIAPKIPIIIMTAKTKNRINQR